jgi:hypothetical protein
LLARQVNSLISFEKRREKYEQPGKMETDGRVDSPELFPWLLG